MHKVLVIVRFILFGARSDSYNVTIQIFYSEFVCPRIVYWVLANLRTAHLVFLIIRIRILDTHPEPCSGGAPVHPQLA